MKFRDVGGRLLELQAISALLMKKLKIRIDDTGIGKEIEEKRETAL